MMDLGSREMYHIGLRPEQGAAYALLTGDPGRVEAVAARLEDPGRLSAPTGNIPPGREGWKESGCWSPLTASAAPPPPFVWKNWPAAA